MTPTAFPTASARPNGGCCRRTSGDPLTNKTLNALYPPGSTIKPMNALALQAAGVDPDETIHCPGGYRLGNRFFRCLGRHGTVNMRRAIAKSCNTYFYAMGHRVGYDRIAEMAKRLGLGQKFDLPVVSQSYGTVPDSAWKARNIKDNPRIDRAARLDRVGHAQRVDRPGLPDPQSVAAGGHGGADRVGPERPADASSASTRSRRPCSASRRSISTRVRGGMWEVVNGDGTAGRQPAAGPRHRNVRQDRHRAGPQDRRQPARPVGRLEVSRPWPVRLLRALRQPALRRIGGDRAWPRRGARRSAGRQGRADLSVRPGTGDGFAHRA